MFFVFRTSRRIYDGRRENLSFVCSSEPVIYALLVAFTRLTVKYGFHQSSVRITPKDALDSLRAQNSYRNVQRIALIVSVSSIFFFAIFHTKYNLLN